MPLKTVEIDTKDITGMENKLRDVIDFLESLNICEGNNENNTI